MSVICFCIWKWWCGTSERKICAERNMCLLPSNQINTENWGIFLLLQYVRENRVYFSYFFFSSFIFGTSSHLKCIIHLNENIKHQKKPFLFFTLFSFSFFYMCFTDWLLSFIHKATSCNKNDCCCLAVVSIESDYVWYIFKAKIFVLFFLFYKSSSSAVIVEHE